MLKKTCGFFVLAGLIFIGNAGAQENNDTSNYNLGKVIVSATKTQVYQAEVGSSTTVITGEEIKNSAKRSVRDVLRDVPGVSVTQTGALGGTTSVYLRGAKPGHTLVMIDGVEVNDPMETDRSFDFAHLTTDNIERIEVVRGPQSTLYGSDAMAGVINIITKEGKGKPGFEGSFEGGAFDTFRETLGVSGGTEKINYSLSAARLDSGGINKAARGLEDDPYRNTAFSSKAGWRLMENGELSLVTRFTDAVTSLDDGAFDDDRNYAAWWRDFSSKLAFDQGINPWWAHTLSFSYHDVRRKYRDGSDATDTTEDIQSWYKGSNRKAEWQNNLYLAGWDTLTGGFEYEQERGASYYRSKSSITKIDRRTVYNTGVYLQNQFKFWEKLFITPGLRVDKHEIFGSETTYKISTAYLAQTSTRLKGNWGTAFKAPSLYQLYSSYGDPGLKPDKSKSYDLGFEQGFLHDKVSFDLTYFHNDFKDMVEWDPVTYKYKNIGKAMTKGFEIGSKLLPFKRLSVGANFTYTDTEDKETGLELLRRPKRQFNLSLDWKFIDTADISFGITHAGSRKDSGYITAKHYTRARMALSYDVTKNLRIMGRIENMFNRKYQEVTGYATPGRSFYGGLTASF